VLADFLNASPDRNRVLAANMTTLTFTPGARALGRGYGPDDEIVVTELDHHANIAPWRTARKKECGLKVRWLKMIPETGELDWGDFFSRQL